MVGVHPDLHAGYRVAEYREAPGGLARIGRDGDLVDPKTRKGSGMVTAQVDSASP